MGAPIRAVALAPTCGASPSARIAGALDPSLIAASVQLMLASEIGEAAFVDFAIAASSILGAAGPNAGEATQPFLIARNDDPIPVKISLQAILPLGSGMMTPLLCLGTDEIHLKISSSAAVDVNCPDALRSLRHLESFSTLLLPGQKLYGRVVGPALSAAGKIAVARIALTPYLAVIKGLVRG